MFFLMDLAVYLWNVPNPKVSLATLKKSFINLLIGFKSSIDVIESSCEPSPLHSFCTQATIFTDTLGILSY